MSSFVINPYAFTSAFVPTDIPNLGLWLDATVGLFDATTGGNAVTSDGSTVARWEDQSGNGRHATQGTAGNRPTLKTSIKNSNNILRFDGTSDTMGITSWALGSSPAYTIFAVYYDDGKSLAVWLHGGSLDPYISTGNQFNGVRHYDGANTYDYTTNANQNAWNVMTYAHNSSNRRWYRNTSAASAGTASTRAATFTNIGSTGGGFHFRGDFAELLIYSSYLSDTDRESVRDYLNDKWAVY
jgi:hypothetical protein